MWMLNMMVTLGTSVLLLLRVHLLVTGSIGLLLMLKVRSFLVFIQVAVCRSVAESVSGSVSTL